VKDSCPCQKLGSAALTVQSAENEEGPNNVIALNPSRGKRIFAQREMRSASIVIFDVGLHDLVQLNMMT
jgi:hypothetical protein